jgi:hypothetical protein
MSESQGIVGLGTQIKIGNGASPEVFTLVGEPTDIDGPEVTQDYVDFTHMQSTGGFKEEKPTWKSSGNVTFTCAYVDDDAGQILLLAAANAVPATKTSFLEIFPNAKQIAFDAYPSVKFTSPMSGKLAIAVTLKLAGAFVIS